MNTFLLVVLLSMCLAVCLAAPEGMGVMDSSREGEDDQVTTTESSSLNDGLELQNREIIDKPVEEVIANIKEDNKVDEEKPAAADEVTYKYSKIIPVYDGLELQNREIIDESVEEVVANIKEDNKVDEEKPTAADEATYKYSKIIPVYDGLELQNQEIIDEPVEKVVANIKEDNKIDEEKLAAADEVTYKHSTIVPVYALPNAGPSQSMAPPSFQYHFSYFPPNNNIGYGFVPYTPYYAYTSQFFGPKNFAYAYSYYY